MTDGHAVGRQGDKMCLLRNRPKGSKIRFLVKINALP
jgi:hypothetical protein